jgi:hypothetical protein
MVVAQVALVMVPVTMSLATPVVAALLILELSLIRYMRESSLLAVAVAAF